MKNNKMLAKNKRQYIQRMVLPNTHHSSLITVLVLLIMVLISGCAATIHELPPQPPKYVYKEEKTSPPAVNSLWSDRSSLFEDTKARRLNDLVTIRVVENITSQSTADTKTSRDSSADFGVTDFFGLSTDFNIQNLPLLKDYYKGPGAAFAPSVKGSGQSDFQGKGDTKREGKLLGTITAKVVEVMPNGNLVVASRKDIVINNEKQILVLTGMIRPEDIATDNTILSNKVADAEIYYVGDGVIQDKQKPGWLVRALDNIWPF